MFERTGVWIVAGMIGLAGWVMLASEVSAQEAAPAKVQPLEGDTWIHRTTAVDGHLGFATPQGTLGVSLTETFERTFALSGSAGLGVTGPHLSVMPRVQLPWDWGAVGIGVGVTGSSYKASDFCIWECSNLERQADLVLWANAELFFVLQDQSSGLRFGLYGGWTSAIKQFNERLVDPDTGEAFDASSDPYSKLNGLELPYGGINIGYAF